MTDPRPFLDDDDPALGDVRRVLGAGRAEHPRGHLRGAVLGSLGLMASSTAVIGASAALSKAATAGATVLTAGAGAGEAASGASAGYGAAVSAGTAKSTLTLVVAKWTLAGVVAGTVVSGGAYTLSRTRAPSSSVASVKSESPPNRPHEGQGRDLDSSNGRKWSSEPAPVAEAMGADAVPPAVGTAPAKARAVTSPPEPVRARESESGRDSARETDDSQGDELSEELASLRAAQAALGSGNAAQALGLVAAYRREHPHGALGPEAWVLEVEALEKSGEREAAIRRARAFLSRYPESPQSRRLRTSIERLSHD